MKTKNKSAIREVKILIGGELVSAWEAKSETLHALGRWTDPKGLLRRIYEVEHPEENVPEGPGRQWQATWRGRFVTNPRSRARKAA